MPDETTLSEPEAPRSRWRWAVAAGVALMLSAYPLTRWMKGGSRPSEPPRETWQVALNRSMDDYQAGRYENAVTAAKEALALNPKLPEAYNNMAVAYLQLRRYDEGLQAASEALRLNPDFQLAKNNLAWIQREKAKGSAPAPPVQVVPPPAASGDLMTQSLQHAQAGRFKECAATARELLKSARSAGALNNLGFCAGKLGLWDEAIQSLQEAVRLDPNFQLARNNLAAVQRQKLEAGK